MASQNSPVIAITGGGGFLGSTLAEHFADKGWQVIALVRQPGNYAAKPHIKYRAYDLAKPLAGHILEGVDYLVHAAYVKQDRKNPDALDININGAKRLLQAARNAKTKRNVFISSMSAHEDAVSAYGRQKLAIEKLFNTSADVSLRPGLIIGNGGIVKNMAAFMKSKHLVPLIGGGKQPLQIIAIYDLTNAIEQALSRNLAGTLTVATPTVYSYREFYKTLSKHLKTRVLFIPMPFALLLAIFRLISLFHIPLNISEDNLWGLKKLRAVPTESDLKKLGIRPATLETALEKAINHSL